jgi:HEAT repeat protein
MLRTNNIHHQTQRRSLRLSMLIALASAIFAALISGGGRAYGAEQNLDKFSQFIQASGSSNAAIKMLEEGRDLIQEQEWAKASTTFGEFVKKYPQDKNMDAALYWLALSLMKQGKNVEADTRAAQLIAGFPQSSWVDDARAIRLQIRPLLNPASVEMPQDGNTEINIIALQSMFQSRADKGLEIAGDILKADSKKDRRLKEAAISLAAQYGGQPGTNLLMEVARREPDLKVRRAAVYYLGRSTDEAAQNLLRETAMGAAEVEVARAAVQGLARQPGPKATELLSQIARTASSVEVRKDAVSLLGQRPGEEIVEELMKVYRGTQDAEVKKQAVHALSRRGNPSARVRLAEIMRSEPVAEVRAAAIYFYAQKGDDTILDELIKVYDAETNDEIRKHMLDAFARINTQKAQDKIVQVARTSDNLEIRRRAISLIGRNGAATSTDLLIQLYDAEMNVDIKAALLEQIARVAPKPVSGQPADSPAMRKLLQVARTDSSTKLRAVAINALTSRVLGAQTVEQLIQFYDAEKLPEMKREILQRIARWSSITDKELGAPLSQADITAAQKRALRKLMDVARNDSSLELRKDAVMWLGRSKDPEAQRFIEDILK